MIDAFERELARRRVAGSRATLTFAVAAFANLVATGIIERRRRHVVRFGYFFSALDFTLAWRMLVRYPGLSTVSVFGMAVGIAVAAGAFALISMLMDPRLPLPEGDRIVSLLNVDASTSNNEMRLVRDYETWRGLTSVEHLGIARTVSRNLLVEGRSSEPVTVVEISASAFPRCARRGAARPLSASRRRSARRRRRHGDRLRRVGAALRRAIRTSSAARFGSAARPTRSSA